MTRATGTPGVMRAAEYDRYGPAAVLQLRTVDRPRAGPGKALVRVLASTVNPLDAIVRSGQLRLLTGRRFPRRTGIDFAGEVVALGPGASAGGPSRFAVGDRVWGEVPFSAERSGSQGSAAEFVTVATTRIARTPAGLSPIAAAAISTVGAVAIITLRNKAKLRPGERLLVRGARL